MKKEIKYIMITVIIIMLNIALSKNVWAKKISVENAKNAIVEVQAGVESYSGDFYKIKSASGFVIYNQQNGAYIVTTNHTINISNKEKNNICKKKKIDSSASGLSTRIRVIVEGDVSTNVEVKAKSKKDDFCVLAVDDVLNKKSVLHLSSGDDSYVGDDIYVLGYSPNTEKSGVYNSDDVEIHNGKIQDTSAKVSSNIYLQHSAVIVPEQSGGPILDKDGYLLGMANSSVVNKSMNIYYALPIDKIKTILDNYGISYESKEKDIAYEKMKSLYEKSKKDINSNSYKNESKELLKDSVQKTEELLKQTEFSIDDIENVNKQMIEGENYLIKKKSKIFIIKSVLLIFLLIVFIRMLWKIIAFCKLKKNVAKLKDETVMQQKAGNSMQQEDESVNSDSKNLNSVENNEYFESNETVIIRPYNGTAEAKPDYLRVNPAVFDPAKAFLMDQITGKKYYISKKEYRIGKNQDNDLTINSNVISRKHAVIFWSEGRYYIKDFDSANGTFVNGKELEEIPLMLNDQNLISFADKEMKFIEREVQ